MGGLESAEVSGSMTERGSMESAGVGIIRSGCRVNIKTPVRDQRQ